MRPDSKPKIQQSGKYSNLSAVLQSASSNELAALLEKLSKGHREVLPGVTLSTFEAGFLTGELQYSLKPKRRRRKKIDVDHMCFFPPPAR
jgi:hypothetical protein